MTPALNLSFNSLNLSDDKSYIFNFCRKESVKGRWKRLQDKHCPGNNLLNVFPFAIYIPVNLLIILNDNYSLNY